MAEIQLNVETRENTGTQAAKKLRAAEKIPGIFYLRGSKNIPITINRADLHGIWGTESGLLDIIFDDKTHKKAVIRDIQYDPIKGSPIHIDLMGIKKGEKIKMNVAVQLIGTPEGVKTQGGILQHILREVEVECLPSEIPSSIDIDVSELNIGDNLHVSDLEAENVTIMTDMASVIAAVSAPRISEEPEEAEEVEEEEEEGAEPEVLSKKSEDEE
ncbi:50S ribosomal protein L25 [candidate division KSB1 bacterium]|nr:MAG: 50S ribosomal protein L25 [candidate division KSB1 bacterium]